MSTFNDWRWLPVRWVEEECFDDGSKQLVRTGMRWLRWDFWVRDAKPAA